MNYHIEYLTRTPSGVTTVVTPTSVIDVQAVIDDIHAGRATYWVGISSWQRARVRAVPFLQTAYLFANWDGSRRNNLHDVTVDRRVLKPRTGSKSWMSRAMSRLARR